MMAQEDGRGEEIQAILREASSLVPRIASDQKSSVASNIAGAQVRAGDLAGALATAQLLMKPIERAEAIDIIAGRLAKQGNSAMALRIIGRSPSQAYVAQDYLGVADELAENGDFEGAVKAARLIEKDPAREYTFVETLMRIYVTQWRAGDRSGATNVLGEAFDAVQRQEKNPAVTRTAIASMYQEITYKLGMAGNQDATWDFVNRIQDLVEAEQDPQQKQLLLLDLARAKADVGDFQGAHLVAEELQVGAERETAIKEIIDARAVQGDIDGALLDVADLPTESLRYRSLWTIAGILIDSKKFSRAMAIANTLPAGEDHVEILADLALKQAETGDPDAASSIDLAWKAALDPTEKAKADVFETLAVAEGNARDFMRAIDLISTMDPESKTWPLWILTELMVDAGQGKEALTLAETQEPLPRAYALLGIANGELEQMNRAEKLRLGE
jgi:hypothetical protein